MKLEIIIIKIKNNIEKILIALGFVLMIIYSIYTKKNNISTSNTWAGVIGVLLYYLPILSGLWMISNKIKQKRKIISKAIKFFVGFSLFVIVLAAIVMVLS